MGGTAEGGKRAAATMRKKYGKDFYKTIGVKGAAARVNPYMHFKVLSEQDPQKLKTISSAGGLARKVHNE